MKIAVVDDESMFCLQLQMMVQKLSEKKELPFSVEAFNNGTEFVEALSKTRYDIVFMDIFMPDMDGIQTATKLRQLTERTFLIFMTASEGHYPDAFALHAFDYVTKPFTLERIEQVLDEVVEHTPMDEAFIKFNVGSQEKKLYLREIVAVTTDGHYLDILTEDEDEVRVRLTSKEFLELSGHEDRFLIVNRGIIVNMDFIETAENDEVTLTNGECYPISSKKTAAILQQIHDYKFKNK